VGYLGRRIFLMTEAEILDLRVGDRLKVVHIFGTSQWKDRVGTFKYYSNGLVGVEMQSPRTGNFVTTRWYPRRLEKVDIDWWDIWLRG